MRKEIKPTQPVMPSKDLYIQEIASIWDNRILTNSGEKEQRFREMLSAYTQCRNIDLCKWDILRCPLRFVRYGLMVK